MSDEATRRRAASGPVSRRARSLVGTPALHALRGVLTANAAMRRSIARRAGLSESEMMTLDHLSEGPLGPGELARRLELSTPAATGIVDRMVAHGHAERRPHAADGRRRDVHLTDAGREEVLTHLMPVFVALARNDAGFTDEERAIVTRYLDGARAALEQASTSGTVTDG